MALAAAAKLKRFAAATAAKPKLIDEKQWKQNCIDLHQVMGVCHALYVLLEQNNEAVLRVACEIVTCRKSRKALWWQEGWWGDDDKRESFKAIVNDKLQEIMAFKNGDVKPEAAEGPKHQGPPDAKVRAEAEKAKQELASSQQLLQSMELRLKDALLKAEESSDRAEQLEKANDKLKKEVRQMQADGSAGGVETSKKLQDAENRLADAERRLKAAGMGQGQISEKLADAEKQLEAYAHREKELQTKLSDAQKELEQQRKEIHGMRSSASASASDLEKARKEAEAAQKAAQEAAKKGTPPAVVATQSPVVAVDKTAMSKLTAQEVQSKLEAAAQEVEMERQRAAQLEESEAQARNESAKTREELDKLKAELARIRSQPVNEKPQVAAEQSSLVAAEAVVITNDVEEKRLRKQLEETEQENVDLKARLLKFQGTISNQRDQIKLLNEEKEQLESQKMRILKSLHAVKEQLKQLQAIAEKKGYGKIVQQIMEESGLQAEVDSSEFACFNRLYEDAIRRQEKHKKHLVERMGADGLPARQRASILVAPGQADQLSEQQAQQQQQDDQQQQRQKYQEQLYALQHQQQQQQLQLQQQFQQQCGNSSHGMGTPGIMQSRVGFPSFPADTNLGQSSSLPSLVRNPALPFVDDNALSWPSGHGGNATAPMGATWSASSRQRGKGRLPYLSLAGESLGSKLPPRSYFQPGELTNIPGLGENVRNGLGIPHTASGLEKPSTGLKAGWRGKSWAPHGLGTPVSRGPPATSSGSRNTSSVPRLGDVDFDRINDNGPNLTLVGQSL